MSDAPKMTMGEAFDEWMRMQLEEPERFVNAFSAAKSHSVQSEEPGVSEYGRDCRILLEGLMTLGSEFWDGNKVAP